MKAIMQWNLGITWRQHRELDETVTCVTLGEMAFGESFHCIHKEKHHPWIYLLLKHLLEINLVDHLRSYICWPLSADGFYKDSQSPSGTGTPTVPGARSNVVHKTKRGARIFSLTL